MGIFDLFKSKNTDKCKEYLKELIRVAKADGYLENSEYQFILKVAEKLECTSEEVNTLSQEISSEVPNEARQSKEQRLKLLFDLVGIMMIDGSIDPKELLLCKNIAMKSGFEHRVIDDIVYRIEKLTQSGETIEGACEVVYNQYKNV